MSERSAVEQVLAGLIDGVPTEQEAAESAGKDAGPGWVEVDWSDPDAIRAFRPVPGTQIRIDFEE